MAYTPSVFNQQNQSVFSHMKAPQQAVQPIYGMNMQQLQGQGQIPAVSGLQTPMTDAGLKNSAFNVGSGVNPTELKLDDYLKYGQQGLDIAGGLYGMYGQYQANQRANEAMGLARQNHQLNVDAANQYKEFRNNTRSAFA